MFQEVEQHLQSLIASEFLIKLAVRFLCLGETGNTLDRFLHART
jgi:hypothetical protein